VHFVGRARHIANLDLDLDTARGHLATDPVIGPLLAPRPSTTGYLGPVRDRGLGDPR
jgi:hypothetical protein